MQVCLILLVIAAVMAAPTCESLAKAKKGGKGKGKGRGQRGGNPVLEAAFGEGFAKAKLSQPQQAGVMRLMQKYAPQVAAVKKKMGLVYTPEQLDSCEAGIPAILRLV